jgi:hypothetical protein
VVVSEYKPVHDLVQELDDFCRRIRLKAMFRGNKDRCPSLNVPNPTYQPAKADEYVEAIIEEVQASMTKCFSHKRSVVSHMPRNMTIVETTAFNAFKGDKDAIIKLAGKTLAYALWIQLYGNECSEILGCTNTHQQIT